MNRRPRSGGRKMGTGSTSSQAQDIDLGSLFNVATQALAANQSSLNQADTENQNHGDNMVQAFNMISQVMANQQGASPSKQLRQASQYLAKNSNSGSGQVYSQGLAQAAKQFKGQSAVTPDNAMQLIAALLGGGQQPASQGGDLLGALLSRGQSLPQGSGQGQSGIDAGDLLNAGMTFMNAKQQGQSNLQAALTALMSAGPMAQPHRQQSGQLVANALLQAVAGMANRK
ncbi:MAG: DAK2 domain-containing protein [Chloroflexota bacterium]|nr:DAK2 domain-containing protein [Chloroflexota bacterium]